MFIFSVDTFDVKSTDLGHLYKVKIRHDNTGKAPGWLLNKIVITDEVGGRTYQFLCTTWLFKSKDKKYAAYKTEHEIEVNGKY